MQKEIEKLKNLNFGHEQINNNFILEAKLNEKKSKRLQDDYQNIKILKEENKELKEENNALKEVINKLKVNK
jgi:hypothetical protein